MAHGRATDVVRSEKGLERRDDEKARSLEGPRELVDLSNREEPPSEVEKEAGGRSNSYLTVFQARPL